MSKSLILFLIINVLFSSVLSQIDKKDVIVLGVGDSICEGARNDAKGFVGDLGYKFYNIGCSGATLSNANKNVIIPDLFVNFYNQKYDIYPTFIIANGGVNDYFYFPAPLGDIPKVAVKTDEEAEKLNRDTVLGGLEYLFYKMIKFYPKAYRLFVNGHRITFRSGGAKSDWTVTPNSFGYTQTDLVNAIKIVCDLYGVILIDIFNESDISSAFDEYISKVSYWDDHQSTYYNIIDTDGIHPDDLGYRLCYIPMIKKALKPFFI